MGASRFFYCTTHLVPCSCVLTQRQIKSYGSHPAIPTMGLFTTTKVPTVGPGYVALA